MIFLFDGDRVLLLKGPSSLVAGGAMWFALMQGMRLESPTLPLSVFPNVLNV